MRENNTGSSRKHILIRSVTESSAESSSAITLLESHGENIIETFSLSLIVEVARDYILAFPSREVVLNSNR